MSVTTNQYVTIYGIKYVMLTIGVVCAIVFWTET